MSRVEVAATAVSAWDRRGAHNASVVFLELAVLGAVVLRGREHVAGCAFEVVALTCLALSSQLGCSFHLLPLLHGVGLRVIARFGREFRVHFQI